MHAFPWFDVAIILALVLLNGFFAMSELAIVSSRKPRLQAMANSGSTGAATALSLSSDPGKFLSTIQVGITLIGVIAGAYSADALGGPVAERLAALGVRPETADDLGFALVIVATTTAQLMVGELLPKQMALRTPEPIAARVAPLMAGMAKVGAPLVWLLETSTAAFWRLLGQSKTSDSHVTAEELHLVVAEAQTAGVIEESERQMISGVMRLADRPVRGVMTPRGQVDWIDADSPEQTIRATLIETPHSRLPIAEGSVDQIIGVVEARDLLAAVLAGRPLDLRALARQAAVVPDMTDATDALVALQASGVPMALVHDEYGHFEGVVTPADLLAAIAGAFASDMDQGEDAPAVRRADGSWLISGSMPVDEMADRLGIDLEPSRDYHTVAGYVLAKLRHLPATGELFDADDWRFEIVDMDGRKIDKLLATCILGPDKADA